MTIEVEYAPALERCKMVSAYEAREAVGGDGARRYDDVRITDGEEALVKAYMVQGAHVLEGMLGGSLETEGDYTSEEKVVWEFGDDMERRRGGGRNALVKAVQEAWAVYALSLWLENKVPEQAAAYMRMWGDLSQSAVRIARVKRKPQRPSNN